MPVMDLAFFGQFFLNLFHHPSTPGCLPLFPPTARKGLRVTDRPVQLTSSVWDLVAMETPIIADVGWQSLSLWQLGQLTYRWSGGGWYHQVLYAPRDPWQWSEEEKGQASFSTLSRTLSESSSRYFPIFVHFLTQTFSPISLSFSVL